MKIWIVVVLLFFSLPSHAFLVSDYEGRQVNVLDHVGGGRWTVVMLWQLNCVPCEKQKPALEAFHNKYQSSTAHVLGLVLDGHESMSKIRKFVDKKPTVFPSLVVFSDVFSQQIKQETGKVFPAAPGYIVYSPDGELVLAVNNSVQIQKLLAYLESQIQP